MVSWSRWSLSIHEQQGHSCHMFATTETETASFTLCSQISSWIGGNHFAKLCCNYMQMAKNIASPLFDLFWVGVETYLAVIIRGTLLSLVVLVVYLVGTCCLPGWPPVSLLPDRNCLQPLAVRSDTIGWGAIPGQYRHARDVRGWTIVDYIPRLSRSLIVEGNRAVNTHRHQ